MSSNVGWTLPQNAEHLPCRGSGTRAALTGAWLLLGLAQPRAGEAPQERLTRGLQTPATARSSCQAEGAQGGAPTPPRLAEKLRGAWSLSSWPSPMFRQRVGGSWSRWSAVAGCCPEPGLPRNRRSPGSSSTATFRGRASLTWTSILPSSPKKVGAGRVPASQQGGEKGGPSVRGALCPGCLQARFSEPLRLSPPPVLRRAHI